MKFYTLNILLSWLKDVAVWHHPGNFRFQEDGGIKILDGQEETLDSRCLYVGSIDAAADALRRERIPSEGVLMVISAEGNTDFPYELPQEVTMVLASLPLLPLYNRIQGHIHRFRGWNTALQGLIYTNAGLQAVLEKAYQEIPTTILLVNAGFKHLAGVYDPNVIDPTAEELRENGYQSFDTIQMIRSQKPLRPAESRECSEYISSVSNNYTIIRLIYFRGYLAARLCVILNGPERNSSYEDLASILAEYISEYMFSNQGMNFGGDSEFGALAADLIEYRLTDPGELEQRLRQIRLATRRYYHVMLISFPDEKDHSTIPWNYIINQLEYIFPFSNITTYSGMILLLIRKMKRGKRLSFDQDSLLKILDSYHGYACIGNTSEFLTSLPMIYRQTQDVLRLAIAMDPDQRIFYYEDYSIYQIIEMAADSARLRLGTRNLVHLCNNELIALVLYDRKHGTDLVDVLRTYLLHERNTTDTARALYIHRNTMLNKIHKIEEIIGSDLEDPMLRERLLFSCRILEYTTRYRHEDILILKWGNRQEEGKSPEEEKR